jgi:5-methylcytosine-specific restriction endonuclease McrA
MRREFSRAVKLAAWQRCGGRCESCTRKLFTGDIHYDHRNPDALTGEPTLDNCAVLCRACHSAKTRIDVARIAKAKRREAAHIGAKPKGRPMPGSRAHPSGLRKRMSGDIERWT